jgi:hypothetical protein
MQTFKTRRLELSAALAIVSASCGAQVTTTASAGSGLFPQSAAAVCPGGRLASVTNPTTGAVSVFINRRGPGGREYPAKIGTVEARSTGEFPLAPEDGKNLQFEWAQGAGAHDSRELSQVRHKIQCQTEGRDY